jgi:hypothetical protein
MLGRTVLYKTDEYLIGANLVKRKRLKTKILHD